MANRIFVSSVVVLWLGSMAWLLVERIMPSFDAGHPPLAESYKIGEVVAWSVQWGGRYVGHAASARIEGVSGTSELHNRILLEDAPLVDLAPMWLRHAVGDIGNMTFDAVTRIEFDALEKFSSFESRIGLNEMPSALSISGKVKGSDLELKIRSSGISYPTKIYLPNRKALNEALFPDSKLPLLHEGRRWREEVFSPFRTPSNPVEVVQAEVVSTDSMEVCGEVQRVMRVEYRAIVGSGVSNTSRLQAISWVRRDGTVLRHDVFIGGSEMRFERLSAGEAAEIGIDLFERQIRQGAKIKSPDDLVSDQATDRNSERMLVAPTN